MPPRHDPGPWTGTARDFGPGLGPAPGGRRPANDPGLSRLLWNTAAVVALGAFLVLAPHLIGSGARPTLAAAPPAAQARPPGPQPGAGNVAQPAAPQASAPATGVATATSRAAAGDDAQAVLQILRLTNAARHDAGCGVLVLDRRLHLAAAAHTQDMATRGELSHVGSNGSTPADRAAAQGFRGSVGENVARGYGSAQAVMQAWLGSPGHRANIVNCDFRSLGVGHLGDGGWWTELFGG